LGANCFTKMQNSYTVKLALVSGGASGIGKDSALAFAHASAKVVLTGRREKEGWEVAAATGDTARFTTGSCCSAEDGPLSNPTITGRGL
jgi:NADP-dependent 3-hydroxy acid dehydrogenase YdfG